MDLKMMVVLLYLPGLNTKLKTELVIDMSKESPEVYAYGSIAEEPLERDLIFAYGIDDSIKVRFYNRWVDAPYGDFERYLIRSAFAYLGKNLEKVYFTSPVANIGDIHSVFGIPQVTRVLEVKPTVLSFTKNPVVTYQNYYKVLNRPVPLAGIDQFKVKKIEVKSTHAQVHHIMTINDRDAEFAVKFINNDNLGDRKTAGDSRTWNIGKQVNTHMSPINLENQRNLIVLPNQTLITTATAWKGNVKVQVNYVAGLDGDIITFMGNNRVVRFNHLSAKRILRSLGRPPYYTISRDIIDISYELFSRSAAVIDTTVDF